MSNEGAEIAILRFPDNVRKRKEMYLPNKEHLIFEIVDNSIDEAMAGYADMIAVAVIDNVVTVEDNGRGIKVTMHKDPEYNHLTQAEVAYTVLHAGGKFGEDDSYKTATGGLHGVGASVVNALTEEVTLTVKTEGKKHQAKFSRGHIIENMHVIEEDLSDDDTGTEVTFKPDSEMWDELRFDLKKIKKRVQQLAYLNAGLSLYLVLDSEDKEGKRIKEEQLYCYPDGLHTYIEKLTKNKELVTDIFGTVITGEDTQIAISLAYTNSYSEDIYSFCNNIFTEEGGDHLTGFKTGLSKVINEYATTNKLVKEDTKLEPEDTREGLTAVIAIRVKEPKFQGQAKSKLDMPKIRHVVRKAIEDYMTDHLDKNPAMAKIIIAKAVAAHDARKAAQKARENIRQQKSLVEGGLPGKLTDCSDKNPEVCEIYIVEGDSAGGSAKQARDRKTQAILPIFGKILNVEKARLDKVLKNEKLFDLLRALKCGIAEEFDLSKLRYHKVILMSDADVDGDHIKTLYMTFFLRHLKPLVEKGHLYLAMPPLYKLEKGKTVKYAYSDAEKEKILAEMGDKVLTQRYKGLGEMNAQQLWETTMNPESRSIIRVTIEDAEEAEQMVSLCMGEDVKPRREFITDNALEANLDV